MRALLSIAIIGVNTLYGLDLRYGKGSMDVRVGMKNFMSAKASLDVDVVSLHEEHYNIANSNFYVFGNVDIYNSKTLNGYTDIIDEFMNMPIMPLPSVPYIPPIIPIVPIDPDNPSIPENPGDWIPVIPIPMPSSTTNTQSPITIPEFPIDIPDTPNDMLGKFVPVPSSYEMNGFDMDIGVGYDILKGDNFYLGAGISTGMSTPFLKMENYVEAMEFLKTVLDTTETDITTYKIGISFQGGYSFEYFSLYANGIYAYQTGDMTNSLIHGSLSADGTYSSFDIGAIFQPAKMFDDYADTKWSNLYVNMGYTHKEWEIDRVNASLFGISAPDAATSFEASFKTDYTYLGVGYKF